MAKGRQVRRLDRLKSVFAEEGIHPRTRMGQNFLLDKNQVSFIARQGEVEPRDLVLEVGPGSGFLTTELAESAGFLLAVELDEKLFALVSREMAGHPNVEVMQADILDGKSSISAAVCDRLRELLESRGPEARLKCISNLPYSAGTPFAANLFASPLPWSRAVFLLQYEVAQRLLAGPGDPEYGSLSIGAALGGTVRLARKVPPQVFWPRPKVASAVVAVDFLPPSVRMALPWKDLRAVTNAVFCSRRKTLRNAFKGLVEKERGGPDAFLATAGVSGDLRGETLPPETFATLARAWGAWQRP